MLTRFLMAGLALACLALPPTGSFSQDLSAEKIVDPGNVTQVSPDVWVIEDRDHIFLVPNVAIIVGRDAALVVDTGLGVESAQRVLATARRLAGDRKLYLTVTHFHPEHGFGAQVFKGQATIIYNRTQRDEMLEKGPAFISLFSTQLHVAKAMAGVRLTAPDILYDQQAELDLGGLVVRMNEYKAAHTRGDQVISVPDRGVVILGDLLETDSFPIMPWFPDLHDTDVDPVNWRRILQTVAATKPRVVVPGHGRIGDLSSVDAALAHLGLAQQEVARRCAAGRALADIQAELTPILAAQHTQWDLKDWIPMEIQVDYYRLCRSN